MTDIPVAATDRATDHRSIPAATATDTPRRTLWPLVGLAGTVAITVAVAKVSGRLVDIVGLVLFAAATAWLVQPVRAALSRRVGRAASMTITMLLLTAGGLGGGALLVRDLSIGAEALAAQVRDAFDDSSGSSLVARLQRSLRLGDGITEWLSSLPAKMIAGGDGAPAVGQRVVDTLVVIVLAGFFLAEGGRVVAGAVAAWPRQRRGEVWSLLADVDARAGSYLRGLAGTGLVTAAVLAPLWWLVGLPVPVALALWAGFWFAVPTLGWAIGSVPVVAVALTQPPGIALVSTAAAVAAAALVARHRRRRTGVPQLRPGVGVTVACLAVGAAMSGSAAAILVLVVGVVAVAVVTSEHAGVGLPVPAADERDHHVGPITVPHGWRGLVWVLAVATAAVLTWSLLVRSAGAIAWLTLAILLAIAIDRPIEFVRRRLHVPRAAALAVTFVVLTATAVGLIATAVAQGPSSTARALERVPQVVADLEDAPVLGTWLRDHDAADTVRRQLEQLPGRIATSRGASSWFPSLGTQLVGMSWVLLLTAAFVIDGARMYAAVERRVPAQHRRQFRRLATVSHGALAGYAAGAVLVSAMNGAVVLALALVLQVGLAPVLALWAFLWDFVPQVGGFIGGAPLLLFALVSGTTPFVVATVVYLVYQLVESNIVFPAIIGDSVDIPAWATMVAALAGAAAAGVVGAVVLTPLVGVVRVIVADRQRDDFPGRTVVLSD